MKLIRTIVICAVLIVPVFICGVGISSDISGKAETNEKKLTSGDVLYTADFEKENDTCSWTSEMNKVVWKKDGANGSNGCLELSEPADNKVSAEISLNWYDSDTYIDFDYYVEGFNGELDLMSWGARADCNLSCEVKDFVKGKWAHAQCKAKELKWRKKSGKNDVFRNLMFMASGLDSNENTHVLLIDNVTVTAQGQKPEGVSLKNN